MSIKHAIATVDPSRFTFVTSLFILLVIISVMKLTALFAVPWVSATAQPAAGPPTDAPIDDWPWDLP